LIVTVDDLTPYGWNEHWAKLHAASWSAATPGRVIRHDGSALLVATPDGIEAVSYDPTREPVPVVGDWVALESGQVTGVLERESLLRRRTAGADSAQPLAANVDVVLLVCGLDRPVKAGRIQRGATLAHDAGAVPKVVLTKAALHDESGPLVDTLTAAVPGIDVIVTSVRESVGLDELVDAIRDRTVVLLGESGAGKSSIVNALLGEGAAATGAVRAGDAKGRHTTTSRYLHVLPGGGTLIDTPGIREVGVWVDPDAVNATFPDVEALAADCRFRDCNHAGEPGCAVKAAVAEGTLAAARLEAWRSLMAEAQAVERRPKSRGRRR
jgi:ribosome biogenesis GTPase